MSTKVFGYCGGQDGIPPMLELISAFYGAEIHVLRTEPGNIFFRISGMTSEAAFMKLKWESQRFEALVRNESVTGRTGANQFISFIFYLTPRRDLAVAYFSSSSGPLSNSALNPPKGVVIVNGREIAPPKGLVVGHTNK